MIRFSRTAALAGLVAFAATGLVQPANAAGGGVHIERQDWSFSGPFGLFDQAQLQRGFQVYENVCKSCHGMERIRFRNLAEPGGPGFDVERLKALAANWPIQTVDGPNDDGDMYERPPLLSDAIPAPFKNEKQARATHNGAYPVDLSLIAKARNPEYTGSVWWHPIQMLKDIVTGYQEGGADYLYALLTGYREDAPAYRRDDKGHLKPISENEAESSDEESFERCAGVVHGEKGTKDVCIPLQDGMNYNAAFPGHQIAMVQPLDDGVVDYAKTEAGDPVVPETKEQYARDVAAFLSWAADPTHDQRKRLGWQVLLYLLITTLLLFIAKKQIWSRIKH
jgi:ubiquinol-cytochrome c reductase cytochrome c1 subunit